MGSMGVYAGLIYNDYFSLGLDLFGSNYTFKSHESGTKVSIYLSIFHLSVSPLLYAMIIFINYQIFPS